MMKVLCPLCSRSFDWQLHQVQHVKDEHSVEEMLARIEELQHELRGRRNSEKAQRRMFGGSVTFVHGSGGGPTPSNG